MLIGVVKLSKTNYKPGIGTYRTVTSTYMLSYQIEMSHPINGTFTNYQTITTDFYAL